MSEYEALAKSVVKRSLSIRPKENVIVECWTHGLPIAAEFVHQVRAAGARPLLWLEDEATFWRSATTLPKSKVGQVGSHEWSAMEKAHAYIFLPGPADISKVLKVGWDKWRAAIAYNAEWYRRAEKSGLRGVRVGMGYVTKERAKTYGLNPSRWKRMILDASVVPPASMERSAKRFQRILSSDGHVEVRSPNGTRLSFDLKGRDARIDAGAFRKGVGDHDLMVNVPGGELYVAPDERSTEGTIRFDRPVALTGRWLKGLTLAFDGGRVSKWYASKNANVVRRAWDAATGDKDRVGIFQIGLNPKAKTGFLSDYIVRGNVYVSIGENADIGGRNRTDFFIGATLTRATVTVDGKTILKNGRLAA